MILVIDFIAEAGGVSHEIGSLYSPVRREISGRDA